MLLRTLVYAVPILSSIERYVGEFFISPIFLPMLPKSCVVFSAATFAASDVFW